MRAVAAVVYNDSIGGRELGYSNTWTRLLVVFYTVSQRVLKGIWSEDGPGSLVSRHVLNECGTDLPVNLLNSNGSQWLRSQGRRSAIGAGVIA